MEEEILLSDLGDEEETTNAKGEGDKVHKNDPFKKKTICWYYLQKLMKKKLIRKLQWVMHWQLLKWISKLLFIKIKLFCFVFLKAQAHPLTKDIIKEGLSLLCRTVDRLGHAFIKLNLNNM